MAIALHREDLQGGVVRLTLDNARAANALTDPLLDDMRQTFLELDQTSGVRCLILRGQGGKTFSSGYDTSQLDPARFRGLPDPIGPVCRAMIDGRLPIVGAINGHVLGGAVEIAACCDIRIGQIGSTVGIPAGRFGICYAPAGIARLREALGPQLATELLLRGHPLPVERALQAGFFSQVLAAEAVDRTAEHLARDIALAAPLAVEGMRRILRGVAAPALQGDPVADATARDIFETCLRSDDLAEGLSALQQQRVPAFDRR